MRARWHQDGWWLGLFLAVFVATPGWAETQPPLTIHYIGDLIADAAGGRTLGVNAINRLDVGLSSGDRLFGIDGVHARAEVMLLGGGGFSAERSGDYQVVSNIDAPHAVRPYEVWIEAPLSSFSRIKAGLIDLNNDFDVQAVGSIFLNSSFGIGPDLSQSGPNGPSIFPITAPGLELTYQPPGWTARLGVFDARAGDPAHMHRVFPDSFGRDGALLIGEGHVEIGPRVDVQAGIWTYSEPVPRIDRPGRGISAGGYAMIEARLIDGDQGRALRGWLRAGEASDATNPIGAYVGGGLLWGNDATQFGAAVAHARLGDPARRAGTVDGLPSTRAETAIEATARWRVARGLALQPDAQYVVHPSWNRSISNALVFALRVDWIWLVAR